MKTEHYKSLDARKHDAIICLIGTIQCHVLVGVM